MPGPGRPGRGGREVRVVDARRTRGRAVVAGDLDRPGRADVHDDHLLVGALAVDADPHALPAEGVRDGVLPAVQGHHRAAGRDGAGHPERDRVRARGHRVQPGLFVGEHLVRGPPRHPVDAGVDHVAELLAGSLEVGEGVVGAQQVRLGRHEVGLGELDGVLTAALRGRVGRLAGVHGDPVVRCEGHDLRVPHRHPGDVSDRHSLLVVRQHIGRRPAQAAQHHVQGGEHGRGGAVPQREHDPEPRPRQPGAEQDRLAPVDDRAVAEVVLQPHARLGHPRAVDPAVAEVERGLRLVHRPPCGALGTAVAQREELLVGLVRADLPEGVVDPLLDLGQELFDQLRAGRGLVQPASGLPGRDVAGDGVMGTAGQLGGISKRSGQVERCQNFHDLPCRLNGFLLGRRGRFSTASAPEEGPEPREAVRQRRRVGADPVAAGGQFSWPPAGSYVAVSGQDLVAAVRG